MSLKFFNLFLLGSMWALTLVGSKLISGSSSIFQTIYHRYYWKWALAQFPLYYKGIRLTDKVAYMMESLLHQEAEKLYQSTYPYNSASRQTHSYAVSSYYPFSPQLVLLVCPKSNMLRSPNFHAVFVFPAIVFIHHNSL